MSHRFNVYWRCGNCQEVIITSAVTAESFTKHRSSQSEYSMNYRHHACLNTEVIGILIPFKFEKDIITHEQSRLLN